MGVVNKESYYCEKLTDNINNKRLVKQFKNKRNEYLEEYLKKCAWNDEVNGEVVNYLIKCSGNKNEKIVLYFTLKTGVLLKDFEEKDLKNHKDKLEFKNKSTEDKEFKRVSTTIPAIELSKLCINEKYREELYEKDANPTGIGAMCFFNHVVPIVTKISNTVGCKILYLFAADDTDDGTLVNHYKTEMGFIELKSIKKDIPIPIMSYCDNKCTFMYQKISNFKK